VSSEPRGVVKAKIAEQARRREESKRGRSQVIHMTNQQDDMGKQYPRCVERKGGGRDLRPLPSLPAEPQALVRVC
jgi:hypothetical protein